MSTLFLLLVLALSAGAQEITLKGRVLDGKTKNPVKGAQIFSVHAAETGMADESGQFELKLSYPNAVLKVTSDGYFPLETGVLKRESIDIYLMPASTPAYLPYVLLPEGRQSLEGKTGSTATLNRKDFRMGYTTPDQAIQGALPGMHVLEKSGMPGEGSFVNLHGLRSLAAATVPLIVVDGMPYLPNDRESLVIGGFSRNIFAPLMMGEIENISLVKGADAAEYGSLGSNGVILVETEKATDMETKVEFQTVNGIGWMKKRLPLMAPSAYKTYLGDIGETAISDLNTLVETFPFLRDDPEYFYDYLYNNDTDWQDEIYTTGFTTENMLKVKGGDAIANYTLTAGYMNHKGILDGTDYTKYFTRLNANINVTKNLHLFATATFGFNEYNVAEQGMTAATNPMLAAYYQAPMMSVLRKDRNGNYLQEYAELLNGIDVSNPVALLHTSEANVKANDIMVNAGLNYHITSDLAVTGMVGLYYNSDKEGLFIAGKDRHTTAKLVSPEGIIYSNMVRNGFAEALDLYIKGEVKYHKLFNDRHDLNLRLGYQMMTTSMEADRGEGYNTTSDFYKTLDRVEGFKSIEGYIEDWNWMNTYLSARYNFNRQFYAGVNVAMDGASSTGKNSQRFLFLPSVNAGWNVKNTLLQEVACIDHLMLRGEYGMNANSRFSSAYSQYIYGSKQYRDVAGIVRTGIPNTKLASEKVLTAQAGLDLVLLGNRLNLRVDAYEERTKEMLMQRKLEAVYGFGFAFDNSGEMKTRGIDVGLDASLLRIRDFEWRAGGSISTYRTEVVKLGGDEMARLTQFTDGTTLLTQKGEAPYRFYGYQYEKIFTSQAEADQAGYVSYSGRPFAAGDVKWIDHNNDKIIDEADMRVLGDPRPDFFGSFYSSFKYKNIGLLLNFTYSYGNEIYNKVRRNSESMTDFSNQTEIAARRWSYDGQQTDVPRAIYGDPYGNARFSDRWIEDGSFLKLKDVTLSYELGRKLGFIQNAMIYVTGQNLWTASKYLGIDPEFSYSYDPQMMGIDLGKIPLAKSVKLGIKLQF
jgi:TonB-linked SusC/RagA family outer membrane protein